MRPLGLVHSRSVHLHLSSHLRCTCTCKLSRIPLINVLCQRCTNESVCHSLQETDAFVSAGCWLQESRLTKSHLLGKDCGEKMPFKNMKLRLKLLCALIPQSMMISFIWASLVRITFCSAIPSHQCRLLFLLGCRALHCAFYTGPATAPANLMLLINNACIQHARPHGSRSPLTRCRKSHSSQEPLPSLWTSSSSSSPMSSLASRCTGSWTGRAISSTPPRTLRYSQPDCTQSS